MKKEEGRRKKAQLNYAQSSLYFFSDQAAQPSERTFAFCNLPFALSEAYEPAPTAAAVAFNA
jgi:hypothetical protein